MVYTSDFTTINSLLFTSYTPSDFTAINSLLFISCSVQGSHWINFSKMASANCYQPYVEQLFMICY